MSSTISDVRTEMFDIIGHIDYDDISDLDTNWKSLADTLKKLSFSRQVDFQKPKPKEGAVALALEDIVQVFPLNLDSLIHLIRRMEQLSLAGSSDALDEESADELKEKSAIFEIKFGLFIKMQLPSLLRL